MTPSAPRERRLGRHVLWSRLLDVVPPAPDPDRLVPVTEVSREALPLVEGSLADVGLSPALQELRTTTGGSRFAVLVPRHDAPIAAEVVAGI
jgi:hypothetical protein